MVTFLQVCCPPNAHLPKLNECGEVTMPNKILGGRITDLFEYPWMALLEYTKRKCTYVFFRNSKHKDKINQMEKVTFEPIISLIIISKGIKRSSSIQSKALMPTIPST